jgi:hypothetical protein
MEILSINQKEIPLRVVYGRPCMTMADITNMHDITYACGTSTFHRNKSRFEPDKDYLAISSLKAKTIGMYSNRGCNVFFESGYLKLVKCFGDDLSWEVQTMLIENYFNIQTKRNDIIEISTAPVSLSEKRLEVVNQEQSQPSNLDLFRLALAAIDDASKSANKAIAIADNAMVKVDALALELKPNVDYQTLSGYCNVHKMKKGTYDLQILARKCKEISKKLGFEEIYVPDARWGKVKSYHVDAISRAINELENGF